MKNISPSNIADIFGNEFSVALVRVLRNSWTATLWQRAAATVERTLTSIPPEILEGIGVMPAQFVSGTTTGGHPADEPISLQDILQAVWEIKQWLDTQPQPRLWVWDNQTPDQAPQPLVRRLADLLQN